MRKLFLLTGFFLATPIFIFVLIIYFSFLIYQQSPNSLSFVPKKINLKYAALPSAVNFFNTSLTQEDARVETVRQFFARYHAPLQNYAPEIVAAADANNIDYRLLPAIAMQESQGGKNIVPGSNNPAGWGINSKQTLKFASFPVAIATISKGLANYKKRGLVSLEQIGSLYNPNNTDNWTGAVNYFMNQLN